MDAKKWINTSYIKHKRYDLLRVSEARLMCFNYSGKHNLLYVRLSSIY